MERLVQLLQSLKRDGVALVVIEHHMDLIMAVADNKFLVLLIINIVLLIVGTVNLGNFDEPSEHTRSNWSAIAWLEKRSTKVCLYWSRSMPGTAASCGVTS
mgnify:CR=1 FL=1